MDEDIKFQPFPYKTLTFLEWLNQMDNNELFAGKPRWLKVLLAARSDIMASYIDARANDNMFHSMYTKQSVYNFASFLDYVPSTAQCATGFVRVTLKSGTVLPVTIPRAQLVFQTSEAIGGNPVSFSALADFTFEELTGDVPVKEGVQYSDVIPYTFNGGDFEEFKVPREGMVSGSASLNINGSVWSEVTYFFNSTDTSRHFRVMYDYKKTVKIRGGNGVYGQKFPGGFQPTLTARYGGGTRGNVGAGKVNTYSGQNQNINSVTNTVRMSGGSGEESLDKIKLLAPLLVASQDRCVSKMDFLAHGLKYPGVARVYVQPNYYGLLSVRLQVVPNGGGVASSLLLNSLVEYIKSKTLMSAMFIHADTADYQEVDVMVEILVSDGYTYSAVLPYVQLMVRLVVSEALFELKEVLKSEGVSSLVSYINTLWGFSFSTSDDTVLTQVGNLVKTASVFEWGKDIFSNEFYRLSELIDGVEEISVVYPVNIQQIDADKIATVGDLQFMEADKPARMITDGVAVRSSASSSIEFTPECADGVLIGTSCISEIA